jgi:hypothetical protein
LKKKPTIFVKRKQRKIRSLWILAIIIPTMVFFLSLIVSGKLINLNPGCTNATVLSIVPTNNGPAASRQNGYANSYNNGAARYKVKYTYYANEKDYTFTKTFSGMELVGIKAQRSQPNAVSLSISAEDITSIPIKYYKNFPWFHALSFNCED